MSSDTGASLFKKKLMKYTILINQKSIIDNGWAGIIKLSHCAVLDVISAMCNHRDLVKINTHNERGEIVGQHTWCSVDNICKQIPMLDVSKRRVQQIINDLCSVGLVESHPDSKKLNRTYLRMGENYYRYLADTNDGIVIEPTKKISHPYEKNFAPPTKFISHDNTITDNTINSLNKEKAKIENLRKRFLSDKSIESVIKNYNESDIHESLEHVVSYHSPLKAISYIKFKEHVLNHLAQQIKKREKREKREKNADGYIVERKINSL